MPEELFIAEIFGHERGAFTSARGRRSRLGSHG
ncbi:sigma 54-interacting transcriptional regulator [Rhizobium mongolense]